MPYESTYGDPLKPFTIYLNCHYFFKEQICIVIGLPEDSDIDDGCAKIILPNESSEKEMIVNISDLSPIPMSIEYLDSIAFETSYDIGSGLKEWKLKYRIPCSIIGDGVDYSYSNCIMRHNNDAPVELCYQSDLEAIQGSYDNDPTAIRLYMQLKKG